MSDIITVRGAERWWARYEVALIWAAGTTEAGAIASLEAMWGNQLGAQGTLETHQVTTRGYACWDGYEHVIAVASDAQAAGALLMKHVPVPEPTEKPPPGTPPKLEDAPLPTV